MAESKKVKYKRTTATKNMLAMIERVKAINADNEVLEHVPRVEIFGSYLKGQDTVHDLDVFVAREFTPLYNERLEKEFEGNASNFNLEFAWYRGWWNKPFIYKLVSIMEDTYKKVKGTSHVLSIHPYEEKEMLGDIDTVPIIVDGKVDEAAVEKLVNM